MKRRAVLLLALLGVAAAAAADDDTITLVIHTAQDCPVCRAWRESPMGLAEARRLARRFPRLRLLFIERERLAGSETEALYPAEYRFMFDARRGRLQLSPPVPLFEVVRADHGLLARQAGLPAWSEQIVPGLEQLLDTAGDKGARQSG